MSTVDVLAMASAPAPVASQPRQAKSDGFARELEAATRPLNARASQADDNESRRAHDDKGVADSKARRAHERHEPTRRTQAGARDAANASAVNDRAVAGKAVDDHDVKSTKDATSDDPATDGPTTVASPTEAKTNDAATTDSAGPGTASSGEASQDPAVISIAVPVTAITADVAQSADESSAPTKAASDLEPGAAAVHRAGVTGSLSIELAAVKATDSAASGDMVAGPVAGDGTPTGGAGGQTSSGGSQEQAGPSSSPSATGASGPATEGQKVPGAASPTVGAPTAHAASRDPEAQTSAAGAQVQIQNTATAAPTIGGPSADTAPKQVTDLTPTVVAGPAVMTATSQAQAPVAAQASASVPALPVPLASQLSGQLATLRQLPQGEHVLTLTVNPETFGPVKVIAHISRDGVSLEIFGASDQARAALKAALPDLRRDLAGTGLEPKLELGTGGSGGRDFSGDASAFAREGDAQQRPARQTFGATTSSRASQVTPPTTHASRRGGLDLVL